MFLRSKHRLVATIMGILILIIGGTLGVIYYTTFEGVKIENRQMLEIFANSYAENGFPDDGETLRDAPSHNSKIKSLPDDEVSHKYQVSTFYAVAFNKDGSTKNYLNDASSQYSDEALISYAQNILESGNTFGVDTASTYLVTEGDDYTLVTMMDTVIIDSTIEHLMKYMITFGVISLFVLLILSILLAKWIIRPLEEGYEKQKQFISDAGHELKTPISTISANSVLLKRELGENTWLNNIIYENERMSVMVHQLLDLAKLENIKPVMEQIDFTSLCYASVMPFEAAAFEKGIDFSYDITDGISIMGDHGALEKLVSVLTDNALSHCLAAGKVIIALKKENSKIILSVSNSGNPISSEEQSKIFERFYRSDESRAESAGHYGLGLSIAKAVVTSHKGKLSVNCDNGLVTFIAIFN